MQNFQLNIIVQKKAENFFFLITMIICAATFLQRKSFVVIDLLDMQHISSSHLYSSCQVVILFKYYFNLSPTALCY